MTVTASERGRSNRRKGHETERNVARYLRAHGFPGAERAVRTGYTVGDRHVPDPLDITGIPGTVWSIKNDQRNEIDTWMVEADRARVHAAADLGLLVVRRRGKATPGRWWVWLPLGDLVYLTTGATMLTLDRQPACLELGDLVPLLHRTGYGDDEEPHPDWVDYVEGRNGEIYAEEAE